LNKHGNLINSLSVTGEATLLDYVNQESS